MKKIITRINESFTLRGKVYICKQPVSDLWIPCSQCIFYKKNTPSIDVCPCKLDAYYAHIVQKCCGSGGVYEPYH